MYICIIYIYICIMLITRIYIYIYIYIYNVNFVKLNTLLIEKGSRKRYSMPTALVWALWSFKICIWSELHWWVLKERNFLVRAGRIWRWALKNFLVWRHLRIFWKVTKNWVLLKCWDNFWAVKYRVVIELAGYHLLL